MLRDGLERAASKLEYTTLATAFVDEQFTISDLRRVFEAVWRTNIDAPNFFSKSKIHIGVYRINRGKTGNW
ncbi:MAG: hypothetical protein Ct9H90mP11_04060 [Acidimicrobiales bacterium]|nr:MAG: hypothetical protein Ct9H90mP11_04060 [Acidimicrobiales bacterium]